MKIKTQFFLMFLLILFVSSCDNSKKEFQQAEDANTKQAYEKFVYDHPESSLTAIANNRIKEIEHWERINESKTIYLYQEHIQLFPNGLFLLDAKNIIQMIMDYKEAKSTDIVKSYQHFLEKYPSSFFSESIERRLKELKQAEKDFKFLENGTDADVLKQYLKKFQDNGYVKIIKERLDKRSIEKYNILLSEENFDILKLYLNEFEGTEGYKLMRSRLDKMALKEFKTIRGESNLDVLKSFINKYPDTKQASIIQLRLDKLVIPDIEKKILNKKEYKRLPKTYETLNKYIDTNPTASNIKIAKQAFEDILIEKLKIAGHSSQFIIPGYNIKSKFGYDGYRYSICTLSKKETLRGKMHSGYASAQVSGTLTFEAEEGERKLFTEYPNDSIHYEYSNSYDGTFLPPGSIILTGGAHAILMEAYNDIVWRFHGNVKLDANYIIYGEPSDPISFYLMKDIGIVYLYGKGKVIKNGKTIFTKQATHGIITIRSNVHKDKVYINDKDYGSTRLDIKLPFGKHELRVVKKGYKPYEKCIDFQESTTIKVKLEKNLY